MKSKENRWWELSDSVKEGLIEQLAAEIDILRIKAKVTQEEIAGAIGVSRQTYNQIESGKVKMSWGTYLSLMFFFLSMDGSKKLLSTLGIFPNEHMRIAADSAENGN